MYPVDHFRSQPAQSLLESDRGVLPYRCFVVTVPGHRGVGHVRHRGLDRVPGRAAGGIALWDSSAALAHHGLLSRTPMDNSLSRAQGAAAPRVAVQSVGET